jgi:uroporphyrinogen decarboxylase
MDARERFLRAARGESVDRPPVWLMRQAGRCLPEYRELRAKHGFLETCGDPALAARVSLQPFERFGMDGVVVFSDILLPLGALGLDYEPAPVVAEPIRTAADLARIDASAAEAMLPTCEAIRTLKRELGDSAAVIGFAGAPWTLAAYASEQRLSRDLVTLTGLLYRDADFLDALLERMAEVCAATLRLQIEAGADALQLFDTWAGALAPRTFARFAGRALRRVLDALPDDRPPVIVYARGAAHLVDDLVDLGTDVVSLDWRVDLGEVAARHGHRVSLQGNLDPAALMAPPDEIERMVAELIEQGRKARGHIVNLGHGIQPQTPLEGVGAFVRAVKSSG